MNFLCVCFLLLLSFFGCLSHVRGERVVMERDLHLGQIPEGWKSLERPASFENELMQLTFALKLRNLNELEAAVLDAGEPSSVNYGRWWTQEQVHARSDPTPESFAVVEEWLRAEGGEVLPRTGGGWVQCMLRVADVERLLEVRLDMFEHRETGTTLFRSLSHYSLPSHIAEHLDFVGNVIRFPHIRRSAHARKLATRSTLPFETTPESIQAMYKVSIPPENAQNSQAVVSFLGQYWSPSDLAQFQREFGLPERPISKLYGYNNPDEPGVEAELDTQFLMGVTNCTVDTWVYSTNGTMPSGNEPFLDYLQLLDSEKTIAFVQSISYQDYEDTVSLDYAQRVSSEFMKNTLRGSTFFTGSGDWGVGCKPLSASTTGTCNYFNADFPSSSPWLVSLGSTTLIENAEQGVAYSSGGFSNYFGQFSSQAAAVKQFLNQPILPPQSYFNSTGRMFPDLATIGTNYMVTFRGRSNSPVAGTSASTPCFAAMVSLMNSMRLNAGKPTMGYLHPFLYEAWEKDPSAYTDITKGEQQDHGCCDASFKTVVGPDAYTGMGTPNFEVLSQMAMSNQMFKHL